jgi:fructose-bisphosphate aldolase class II
MAARVLMETRILPGFVNTREMLRRAYEGRYAVPAFNFVCLEQLLAITDACMETRSPFILQCSANVRRGLGSAMVRYLAQGCAETMRRAGREVPVSLHLDHGMSEEDCFSCIDDGFSSVMIDGSALPFEQNIEVSSRVARIAHERGVTVEAELGVHSGTEEETAHGASNYTDPAAAAEFVKRTSVDSLAVSIGTAHGLVKMKAGLGEPLPCLRFDILDAIERQLPGFPIVLHGASAILPSYVETIHRHGGRLAEARGIPEEQTALAVKSAVRKISIASDGWIAMTAAVREALDASPGSIDPRAFLSPARRAMKELYIHKIVSVTGSAGKGDGS